MVDGKSYRRVGGGVGGVLKGIIAFRPFFWDLGTKNKKSLEGPNRTDGEMIFDLFKFRAGF